MGMFDYLNCKLPLPDGAPKNPYQTKNLQCVMDTYEIKEDGTLWGEDYDREGWSRSNVRPRQCSDFTGEVRFYRMGDKEPNQWWEFSAYFVDGKLIRMETISQGDKP